MWASCAAAWWARRHRDHAMTAAGWIWHRAKREATRRISCTDQRISGGSCGSSAGCFWGCGRVRLAANGGQHRKGQHDERDVPVPAVPGTGLVVVEAEFVFGRLEAVLDGPALSFNGDQYRNRRAGGAPGGEEGQVAISDVAADQQASGSQTGQGLVVFGRLEISQFQISPVKQPLALGSAPGR